MVHMTWYQWVTLAALGVFLGTTTFHLIRLIQLGRPDDRAPTTGRVRSAVIYSMTGAMNPAKKESAFLHLPTYTAGLLFHLGTFLSLLLFFLIWFHISLPEAMVLLFCGFLALSVMCGFGILLKRISGRELRELSNPDDYISNLLVDLFQAGTLLSLIFPEVIPTYFIIASILFLYIPLSKLKHLVYFFAARYHLGFFYGWRGVWPPGRGV